MSERNQPIQPSYVVVDTSDPHWVIKLNFVNIVKAFLAKGDTDSAAFYQDYLDNHLGGNPTTLF